MRLPAAVTLLVTGAVALLARAPLEAEIVPSAASGFRVSPVSANHEGSRVIGFDGDNFLVVWWASAPYATRVTPAGEVLDPNGIQLGAASDHVPSVAFDGTNSLVIWVAGSEIHGARVAKDGTVLDSPELVLASDAKPRRLPIAFDGTNYLIAWRTSSDAIRAARISKDGVNLDGTSGFAVGTGFYPTLAYGGGVYLLVWHNWGPNGLDIYGARIGTDGTVLSPGVFPICTAEEYQDHASVASNGTDFLAVWHDYRGGNDHNDGGTWGARITASGTVLDDPAIVIAPYSVGQTPPTVAFDGTDYIVAWYEALYPAKFRLADSYARRVSSTGLLVDDEPNPLATSFGHQAYPSVAFGAGQYLVVWSEEYRCWGGCVYGRLFEAVPPPRALVAGKSALAAAGASAAAPIDAGWVSVASPMTSSLHAVDGSDDAHVYAVGEAADGYAVPLLRFDGSEWSVWTVLPQSSRMYSIYGRDPNDIWVAGFCFSATHFDGQNWSPLECHGGVEPGIIQYAVASAAWRSHPDTLMMAGNEGGVIFHDGTCWASVHTGSPEDVWGLWGTEDVIYAPAENGTILSYDNPMVATVCSGVVPGTWSRMAVPTIQSLNAVWGSARDDVFAVGDAGVIVHWDGTAWTRQASGTKEHLMGVSGFSGSDVYAVGFGGTILHYDGSTWTSEASGVSSGLFAVACIGSTVWAVGDNGVILKKPGPEISVADAGAVTEGDSGLTTTEFTLSLSKASTSTVTVHYATAAGTAQPSSDFAPVQGTVSFAPGATTSTLGVGVRGDRIDEDDETFQLRLSEPFAAMIVRASGAATITDDDTTSFLITDARVREGNSGTREAMMKVSLSLPTTRTVRVSYSTADGSANSGTDYVANSGTLEFKPGQRTVPFTIGIKGDRQPEPNEAFWVNLSDPVGAPISRLTGRVVVLNDDQ